MKKITIIFMSVLIIFVSCSMNIPYDDINKNTETVEEPKEDDTKNNTDEPSNEEPKEEEPSNEEDNSENDNDEEGNSENTETVEEPKEEEPSNEEDNSENDNDEEGNSENTETVEEPKEEDTENEDVENKTWCEIDENINILELNYIGYYENFTAIFNSDSNDSELVKTTPFTMRCNIPSSNGGFREIVITVKYNEGKLDFSINSQSPYYTIKCVNYSKLTSTIDIMILHK